MADNLATSQVSLSSTGTSKRCVRHHHRSGKHHHHRTNESSTRSVTSESCARSVTSSGNDSSFRRPSVFSNTSSLSLIEPFSSPASRYRNQAIVSANQKQAPTSKSPSLKKLSPQPSVKQYDGSIAPSACTILSPESCKRPTADDAQQSFVMSSRPSAMDTQPSVVRLSTSNGCEDESSTVQTSASEETTEMQQNVLRVVDSCTLSIKSNTLDLLMAMDREQDRMVRELSDRMKSIQLDHDMLMALERFGDDDMTGEEGGWTMQWTVAAEGQQRSARGSNRHPTSERHNSSETRVLLGVPIHPSRYQKRDPSGVDSKGDKYLVLADSPYYRRTGGPRLVFAWPELYPPPRPLTLRAITSLLRLTAHTLHTLALVHLRPCTEYERTRSIPWRFPAPPPVQRRQYDIIEPSWGQGEGQGEAQGEVQASVGQDT